MTETHHAPGFDGCVRATGREETHNSLNPGHLAWRHTTGMRLAGCTGWDAIGMKEIGLAGPVSRRETNRGLERVECVRLFSWSSSLREGVCTHRLKRFSGRGRMIRG